MEGKGKKETTKDAGAAKPPAPRGQRVSRQQPQGLHRMYQNQAHQQQLLLQQQLQQLRQLLRHHPIFGHPLDAFAFGKLEADMKAYYGPWYRVPVHQPLQTMEGVPLPPGIPGLGASTDPLEAVLGPFPCVKCRSLPFDATFEDILVLFQGLVTLDVLNVGQGEAFVLFANTMDYQMAIQREGQNIGRRYVEIAPATRAEYYEAIATQQMKEHPQKSMKVGGRDGPGQVPDSSGMWGGSTPGLGFFHQKREEQHGGADPMGGHGPIGMVPGMGMGSGGVGGPDRGLGSGMSGGGRPVPGPPTVKRSGGGIQVGEHTGFLRMRGLPFSSTKDDIFKFFDGYNPVAESIVLTYRSDGRATGEAYVGFITPDDSKKAMELHRKSMGTRYIELFISNKDEHGRALQRFGNR